MVRAALAVAGTILQGLTHNPLAAPDILGVNSSAAFDIVMILVLLAAVFLALMSVQLNFLLSLIFWTVFFH
ncbi:iron chelate uptake ABC transporter family permease subunit [Leptolyngbya sp. DQ-M1]|uniref:iron chelate uptake ABC transporter family permease subunit n=1 Tax=Leptolyngbya sp. DQ-M1 TaxID=2933920 RepID=UPI003298E575